MMANLIALCALVIFLPSLLLAQSNLGTGDYAMLSPRWPCQTARESESNLPVLRKAVLWNTFGNDTTCLSQYLIDPRFQTLELHLINEPCQRNRKCGDYEFLYGMSVSEYDQRLTHKDPALLERLKSYAEVPAKFLNQNLKSHTTCFISPGLESNLSMPAAKVLIDTITPLFPQCKIVWNPAGINRRAKPIPGTYFELHGSNVDLKAPCIADLDGEDISFPTRRAILPNYISSLKIPAYIEQFSECEANFLWIAEFNGIQSGPFIDPRKRINFPTKATFDLVNDLIESGTDRAMPSITK